MIHKQDLQKLKQQDIYSLMLFALYKLQNIPEYSSLSELAYVLDKDSLLNVCEFFGGQTITIPTVDELEIIVYALTLYQLTNVEHIEFNEAVEMLSKHTNNIRKVKNIYRKLVEILDEYKFSPRIQ